MAGIAGMGGNSKKKYTKTRDESGAASYTDEAGNTLSEDEFKQKEGDFMQSGGSESVTAKGGYGYTDEKGLYHTKDVSKGATASKINQGLGELAAKRPTPTPTPSPEEAERKKKNQVSALRGSGDYYS